MSDDTIPEQDESSSEIGAKMSLETPSSLSQFTAGDTNGLGLPFQNETVIGGPLIQTSSHYRHSRAYRHFKNPPQPHMCIRTTTESGEELFINVLSWTRIVIPQEPSDPIPLYGGMRVPPGNPRCPPIVFAVMANPEVLKDSGRHSKDPEERRAMVELMCDFVEAMNPGVKLIRNAVILKDRDISGELKDIWNAVQAQRDREREEQMVQQRQQQQIYSTTTQQLFPKMSLDDPENDIQGDVPNNSSTAYNPNKVIYSDFGPDSPSPSSDNQEMTNSNVESPNDKSAIIQDDDEKPTINKTTDTEKCHPADVADITTGVASIDLTVHQVNNLNNVKSSPTNVVNGGKNTPQKIVDTNTVTQTTGTITTPVATTSTTTNTSTTVTKTQPTAAPSKKDKLSGFLPNGCIFPRFKNSKHKDKDKEKDKDNPKATSKDKEKNLLHVLKKNRDKHEDSAKTQYEKNCLNLETEVEKLDLNKIETPSNNDNIFMKLKVATSAAK